MPSRPLSEICEAHLDDGLECDWGRGGRPRSFQQPCRCARPDDESCPALRNWLATPVSECIIEGDECHHLTRYDPSPAGIGLPGGFMFDCDVDSNPSKCPLKAWEDDMPSECKAGGE